MIVCHKHKFIFVKTQKTASTSIEIALSKLCDDKDILTPITLSDEKYRKELGYQCANNYKIPFNKYKTSDLLTFLTNFKRLEFYNHMPCRDIKHYVGEKIYNDYYKFCFERNPYDKVISLFYHQGGFSKWDSIKTFILNGGLNILKGYNQYTINNQLAVDDIFKFENLEEALKIISKKIKLQSTLVLPKRKLKSEFRKDKRHYNRVLTLEEKELIDSICKKEIEFMNYDF